MQVDTWEGEFNGAVSPSTVRENIEVRFLFYSSAGGCLDNERQETGRGRDERVKEKDRKKEKERVKDTLRRSQYSHQAKITSHFALKTGAINTASQSKTDEDTVNLP